MMLSSCNGNSHTALGAFSRYRPIRCVRSVRVALPTARLHLMHASAMSSWSAATPLLLTRCGRLSARQVPVLHGPVVRSAWRRLGSSVDAPREVQALPLPVLRVTGQLPTSTQSRCATHSDSTLSLPCRVLDPCAPSAPARASRSVYATTNRGRRLPSSDDEVITMNNHFQISRCMSECTWAVA